MSEPQFSDWIGRKETAPADVVTPRLIAGFAATFGEAMAQTDGAPAGLHWCLSPPAAPTELLGSDGHPAKGGFLPPIPLPRRMWAGGEVSFLLPLHVGDEVVKTSTIKAIDHKRGRSGDLCFVTLGHDYVGPNGVAIREDQNIVYRAAPDAPSAFSILEPCSKVFDFEREVAIDTVSLFRYSALTFNGHRIHYDLDYARNLEFYPDLVIHGPLQATFLLNLAARHLGHMPKTFAYRGVTPATGTQTLRLGLNQTSDTSIILSVIAANGDETMTGEATW